MNANEEQVIKYLNGLPSFSEVRHIKMSFVASRKAKDGTLQKVEIQVYDEGPDVEPHLRYSCEAKTHDGKLATGNPGKTVDEVLSTVQWHKLDQEHY